MTYADDVERHYLRDPLCSDEHYAYLMDEAHRSDLAAEARAERDCSDEQVERDSLTNEGGDGILVGMTLPIATTLGILTTQIAALLHERTEADERYEAMAVACEQAERDLHFADTSAAVDKQGAVRIVDELVAELAQEKRLKATWVDATLHQRALVHDLETLVSTLEDRLASANGEIFHLENALGEAQDLVHDLDARVNYLQVELDEARRSA